MKQVGKFRMLAIASLSAVALSVPVALAQTTGTDQDKQVTRAQRNERGRRWGHRGEFMKGGFFGNLNLTDEQKARLSQVTQSFRERTQPLRQELRSKRQELRQASEGGTFNEAVATQKLAETAPLRAKLMGEQFKLHQEMLSVLTPEQKTQLEQKRAEFKNRWAERSRRQAQ